MSAGKKPAPAAQPAKSAKPSAPGIAAMGKLMNQKAVAPSAAKPKR